MLTKDAFEQILEARETLVIDGALATELETRGHDLNHVLWSAKTLCEQPDSIEQVHLDYFLAGADIAITASYQAATQGLHEHFGLLEEPAKDLIIKSVVLAQRARTAAYKQGVDPNRRLLVAGSVGPYGAYLANGAEYTGDYVRTPKEFKDFHRPRIQALIDAKVDLLAVETIPNLTEISTLLQLLQEEFPAAIAWLSCTLKSPLLISDSTPWRKVLEVVNQHGDQIIGFGVNCVPFFVASGALNEIRRWTQIPLVCYPNSGEIWDATTNTWRGQRPDDALSRNDEARYDETSKGLTIQLDQWTAAGAKLIGGCCRTGPAFIRTLSRHLSTK